MNKNDLSQEEQHTLLKIARDSIEYHAGKGNKLPLDSYEITDGLKASRGAFVTLKKHGELRGCIGYIQPRGSLAEAVRDNAVNAGYHDPRFRPLNDREIGELHIEVSAMRSGTDESTPFIPVQSIEEIVLGRDGLYLEHAGGMGGGILLPQVPVEYDWTLAEYLEAICRKAGAPKDAWKNPNYRLYRFSAEVFGEIE